MNHILIVDDNAQNLYLLRALLEGTGFTVDEASDGAEALEIARKSPPELTVSDLLMPGVDGFTLLRRWRADAALRDIPFIVYTATYTEPREQRLAMALGADAYLLKPAEPQAILAQVRDVLDRKANGTLPSHAERPLEDQVLLQEYNQILVYKLEKKTQELQRTNEEMEAEVAERKRRGVELAQVGRLLAAVVEGTTDAVFVKDRDGKYLLFNEAASALVGKPVDEVLGKDDTAVFEPVDAATVMANDRLVIESGEVQTVEEVLYAAGLRRTYHAIKAPYRDEAGHVIGVVGVSRDITERRELEEQLRQSQKMEAVGLLAGGIAHDFNNLLTVISGNCDLILSANGISGTDREAISAIRDAGERAASLTRQLLGFSRQTMLRPEVLDPNEVISQTAGMLQRLIGEHVVFQTVFAPDVRPIRVDPGQLDQILMNLTVNARDAMPRGGTLTLETANVVLEEHAVTHLDYTPGPHVMLAISDSGIGMSREVVSRVFEPFFTTKAPGEGTGLGLAMVFGIVKQSGGCIHVYSEPGHGTSFRLYFPVAEGAPKKAATPAGEDNPGGDETILLVEDDDSVRKLALICLQRYGYTVLAACDGYQALQVAREYNAPIHLVLTDVVMPNMGGPELVDNLLPLFPEMKVIFTSGYTSDAVVRHGLLKPDVAFMQKPYTLRALARKVRQVVAGEPHENAAT